MPKVRTSRRVPAHRRSTRQSSARPSASRQQSESPEQRELREDRERLRPLEEADALMVQHPQVGSFTDILMSPSPLDGLGMDMFPEDHIQFPDDLSLANLNNGGPVGGSSMPPTTSLHFAGSQASLTATAAPAAPSWASPQPNLAGFALAVAGRTAGEIAFQIYGHDIRIDTALCKKLAGELAMRDPIQRRPETKLNMERRSNVEAFLGYVTGVPVRRACKNCTKGHGPWHECVILESQLCGSCTNCWFNASGSRCTFHAAEELGMRIAEYDEYLQTPEGRNEERLFQEQTQGRIVEEQNEEHNRATPATASDESMGNPNSDDNEYR
ncbi:hypothetical protein FSOLCH5_002592 [Fusarium solani]